MCGGTGFGRRGFRARSSVIRHPFAIAPQVIGFIGRERVERTQGCGRKRVAITLQQRVREVEKPAAPGLAESRAQFIERVVPRCVEKARAAYAARRQWTEQQGGQLRAKGRIANSRTSTDPAVMRWYALELQPRLTSLRPAEIARALAVSQSYSLSIRHGRIPHPRHFAALA